MALHLYKTGVHSSTSFNTSAGAGHNVNHDCPTNPVIRNNGSAISGNYICAEIRDGDGTPTTMIRETKVEQTCTTTSGDATVTVADSTKLLVGQQVTGTGITGTVSISSITSGTTIELSANATASGTNTLTFNNSLTYNENLEKTAGYRVKSYYNETGEGQLFSSLNLTTHDYFILLFADDANRHHFAKITEVITDDVAGDALEFTPKLGEEIPEGTKFIVFKGPSVTDTEIVAVTAGLKLDSGLKHHDALSVSRPLFFMYNDRLTKKNQLDHNRKYKLCYFSGGLLSSTSSHALSTISVFTTVQDFHLRVLDRGRHSLNVKMIDNRKKMDDPTTHTNSNIPHDSGSKVRDVTSYDSWALNARRNSDDSASGDFAGAYKYLFYEDSPNTMNRANDVFDLKLFNSIQDKAGYAEVRLVDGKRIFNSKHNTQEKFGVREKIIESSLDGWFETGLTVDSITSVNSTATTVSVQVEADYNARVLWGEHEEIKVGDYIGFIDDIGAPSSGAQSFVIKPEFRLETESSFTSHTSSAPFSAGAKIYRRKWSPKTRTLMVNFELDTDVTYTGLSGLTSHPLDIDTLTYKINNVTLGSYTESRFNNAFVVFSDINYVKREIRVSYGDKTHKCLRLEPDRVHYQTVSTSFTNLDYAQREFFVELELFDGIIEDIAEEIVQSQPIVEVSGRNDFHKLVSPIVNKNTLFAQDIVHSTMSPLRKRTAIVNSTGIQITVNADHAINVTSIATTAASGSAQPVINKGDIIYDSNNNFVGIQKVDASTNALTLEFGSLVKLASGTSLFAQSGMPFTFKKALASSTENSNTVSSLEGASNKGVFFNSGISIDEDGVETGKLAGSSSSSHKDAVGYNFASINNIKNDRAFQAILQDDSSGTKNENRVVNGLSDFAVLGITQEDGRTSIQLAPRVGLYLGRVEDNDIYDANNMTLETTGITLSASSYSHSFTNTCRITTASTSVLTHFARNDPVFVKVVSTGEFSFLGYFIRAEPLSLNITGTATAGLHTIILDREINLTIGSATTHELWKLDDKDSTDLYFINKPSRVLQLASPFVDDNWGLIPFNVNIHDTNTGASSPTTDYTTRYGQSLFRLMDLERGVYDVTDEYPIVSDNSSELQRPFVYYDTPSSTRYYSKSHRFKPSYLTTTKTITNSRTDDSSFTSIREKQGLFEKRGNKPSRGSNFFDYYLTGNTHERFPYPIHLTSQQNRTWERTLRQMDAKVSRNLLFTNSDLLPESDRRPDSLYKNTRDITDYSILLQASGNESTVSSKHSKYLGGGSSLSTSDDNTKLAQIASGPDLSTLRKFSMIRLVEMTLDWHFNSVDAENLPDRDKTLDVVVGNALQDMFTIKNGSTVLSLTGYGSGTITFSGTPDNIATSNEVYFYSENGFLIGVKSSGVSVGSTITLSAGPHENENMSKGTLTKVYAFISNGVSSYPNYSFIRGHNDEDTFVNMPNDGSIHMLKGAVFNNDDEGRRSSADGYAEDNGDDFHEERLPTNANVDYSMFDLLASHSKEVDIALPPTFRSDTASKTLAQNSDGENLFLRMATNVSDAEPATISVQAIGNNFADNMVNNVQYHLFIRDGHYLGRTTANQTYNSGTITLEKSFYKNKMDSLSQTEREIFFSEEPDESLISTHRNTHISEVIRNMAKNTDRTLFDFMTAVFLDRYDIEDGGQASVAAGMVSPHIIETVPMMDVFTTDLPHKLMLRRKTKQGFAHYLNTKLKTSDDGNSPYLADGAFMLFKPHLVVSDVEGGNTNLFFGSPTIHATGSTNCVRLSFDIKNMEGTTASHLTNAWLNFAPNLTGTYLVSTGGKRVGVADSTNYDNAFSSKSSADSEAGITGSGEMIPEKIHYVISHTITRTADCTRHILVIDNASSLANIYKIMRVAENTFYDFTPKIIQPYMMTAKYTKKAYSDECYDKLISYRFRNKSGNRFVTEDRGNGSETYAETGHKEAVASMYVIADPSNKTGSDGHLVLRSPTDFIGTNKLLEHEDNLTIAMYDGDNTNKSNLSINQITDSNTHEMKFEKMANMKGATSIGEVFSIDVIEEVKGTYADASIGCGVNICFESNDLLNDIFEDEGLVFEKQDFTDFPLFISPEYRGVSLLTAANFILDRKNKKLIHDKKFSIRDADSVLNKPNVVISEQDSDISIKSITKGKRLFDVYNEVIVYGRNVKAVRKNLRSIEKIGKKSLEILDTNLYTQFDAEQRASNLLRLHSKIGETIEVEAKGDRLFLLKVGDIITLEVASQNILRSEYLILEMEYTLDGFMTIKLGENAKGLEDRFTELLLENRRIKALSRPKEFKEPSKSNDFFENIKIKEIRILARTRSSSGAITLGFTTPLNITTSPLGFTGGATITYTTLLEEDL